MKANAPDPNAFRNAFQNILRCRPGSTIAAAVTVCKRQFPQQPPPPPPPPVPEGAPQTCPYGADDSPAFTCLVHGSYGDSQYINASATLCFWIMEPDSGQPDYGTAAMTLEAGGWVIHVGDYASDPANTPTPAGSYPLFGPDDPPLVTSVDVSPP